MVDADTLAMTGVEALLRWPRRPQGALAPDAFIAIAESSGLIDALGQFVLQRACSDLQPVDDLLFVGEHLAGAVSRPGFLKTG